MSEKLRNQFELSEADYTTPRAQLYIVLRCNIIPQASFQSLLLATVWMNFVFKQTVAVAAYIHYLNLYKKNKMFRYSSTASKRVMFNIWTMARNRLPLLLTDTDGFYLEHDKF